MPISLHWKQHVGFLSPSNPNKGRFVPHLHFLLIISDMPISLHWKQHVDFLSPSNPKEGRFVPHLQRLFLFTRFTIPNFLCFAQ